MNRILCFLLIFIATTTVAAAQRQSVLYNNIPYSGLTLDTGWCYSTQDNPAFANPAFNDARWQPINPVLQVYDLPELGPVRIGWLRLHFKVSAQVAKQTLIMNAWQNCASEIYLDGKLIARQGVVSANPDKMVPLGVNGPYWAIQLQPNTDHVLAVRFAVWHGAAWTRLQGQLFMCNIIDFADYQSQNQIMSVDSAIYYLDFAVFFVLSLLHFSLFHYDRSQRANLYFAVYAIISTISFCMICLQNLFHDARWFALVSTPTFIINLMGGIWITNALGSLFHYRVKKLLLIMWFVYAAGVIYILFAELNIALFFGAITFFTLLEFGITIKALQDKKRGAGIIAAGLLASILAGTFLTVIYAVHGDFSIDSDTLSRDLFDMIATVAPAVGISVYLAREFGLNSRLLREKLVEVENLSAQSLAYEQEKQQILSGQKEELEKQVSERTNELQASLNSLQAAQTQLIQSEKMASLGELTAGIAHEIQNPLNFVNNFSEVSIELLAEMKDEVHAGNTADVLDIADDLTQNLEKIHQHGQRADNIVKGMLEHSRTSTGKKESTDLNKLADEYLRLSYHGLRAKDKSFNAQLITNFAENLPPANVVPQDVGRVLLNLLNNAFYAVKEKQRTAQASYHPTVKVTTETLNGFIQLSVDDNGIGIPDNIRDKIMQPFFTTKPTGQGTGLGLSLSYDIIVKGHNGQITITSNPGEGSKFIILLPLPANTISS